MSKKIYFFIFIFFVFFDYYTVNASELSSIPNVSTELENVIGNDSDIDYGSVDNVFYCLFLRDKSTWNNRNDSYLVFRGSVSQPNNGRVVWLYDSSLSAEYQRELYLFTEPLEKGDDYLNKGKGGTALVTYDYKWVQDDSTIMSEKSGQTIFVGERRIFVPMLAGNSRDVLVFNTNIPIFDVNDPDFIEKINNYLNEGDLSGAENFNFINDANRTESKAVEMPLDFKVTSGMSTGISSAYSIDEELSCHWKQTVDTSDYEYEYEGRVTVEQTKTSGRTDYNQKEFNSGWVRFGNVAYNGSDSVNLTVSAKQLDNLVTRIVLASQNTDNPLRYKSYIITKIEFRVRNVDKSTDKNDCSRWVIFCSTRGGSFSSSGNPDNVRVEDGEGNDYTDESDYSGGYDPVDRDNVSGSSSARSNVAYFLDLIRNGFGFSGNHGLLNLFSAWFSWLPSSFISIVVVGFGLIVFVSVVKIIIDILT